MIYPARLKKGDTIGVTAPAGPPSIEKIKQAIPFFEQMGLRIKLGKSIKEVRGYLAGTDKERLEDFHEMIADRKIKAIIFARGGYGTGRFADKIDYELINRNPKIIWGYSDITYLHTAIRQKADLITFHGPMLASDVAKDEFDDFSGHMFKQLFEPTKLYYSEKVSKLVQYAPGEAEGPLVGGNLSLLVSTLGTPYEIDTKDKLVLLEDIGEESYRVDSMLNQLRLAGKLSDASGIIIGDFADAEPNVDPSLTLNQVFADYFTDFKGPVLGGFKIGHCFPHFSVPLGVNAKLSTELKVLEIEPGVR
ncbi:S66 peptidase family protein [Oceanobacillus damuensis]|uniref:S66 peptidase family protein n=1 Tax=Oceanobacillus damuensis TaxID=937928 RepID=UPI0008312623|nr:LD-carboxypeptidase [Oceanobacillus damuensis]